MRHISFPDCTTDAVDDLDHVVPAEIAALVRAAADHDGEEMARTRASKALMAKRMFVDVLPGRTDAMHELITSGCVYVLYIA